MSITEILKLFEDEFGKIFTQFKFFDLSVKEARESNESFIWHPGVYVWWHPKLGVIKVGRHLTNSRKRALEHAKDDTAGKMRKLSEDPLTRILLFNVKNAEKKHWVAALEVFFESNLDPMIQSKRMG